MVGTRADIRPRTVRVLMVDVSQLVGTAEHHEQVVPGDDVSRHLHVEDVGAARTADGAGGYRKTSELVSYRDRHQHDSHDHVGPRPPDPIWVMLG
jgi:hypothetical protein